VQAFCHKLQWPQGLIKKVFYQMYETDVVFEDAFGVWREDLTDETPGKDKALIQVNEFLQWLDEAAEEEDGENDD
jgi:translation initiation factor 4G